MTQPGHSIFLGNKTKIVACFRVQRFCQDLLVIPSTSHKKSLKKQQQKQTVVKEENAGTYVSKRHQRSLTSKTNKETRCKESALFNANNCHLRYIKVPLNDLQDKHETINKRSALSRATNCHLRYK